MITSITINLPKKMPLAMQVSETGRRIREWLEVSGSAFNDVGDKLQFTGWKLQKGEYLYHYSIIEGKGLTAGTLNT
jgi:hypothetical protein